MVNWPVFRENVQRELDHQNVLHGFVMLGELRHISTSLSMLELPCGTLISQAFYLLYDQRMIKRHLQSVTTSVVGVHNFRDGEAGQSFGLKWEFLSVQTDGHQHSILRDVTEVGQENALLQQGP